MRTLRDLFPSDRGIALDLVVFVVNLLLVAALAFAGRKLVHAARDDDVAKFVVGIFFAGLVVLQPVGPLLKRWAFHQRSSFDLGSGAGCIVFWLMPVYLMTMIAMTGAGSVLIGEALGRGSLHENFIVTVLLGGFVWSVISVVCVYRYFQKPAQRPRWAFLATPAAERLGDVAMYLNLVGLQIVWVTVVASGVFREAVLGTPLGKPGTFSDILGRLIAIGVLAALVYFPGRLFYLVEDKHRTLTWFTMLLANTPMILGFVLAGPGTS